MQIFQHRMRTTQHVKSVENIMTRANSRLFKTKSNFRKLSPQADNITTYLRKWQIKRENQNLAKRICQCESQHSKDKYNKEWENIKRFMKVRSNFKKTLFAKQPKIFKFEPILGKGKLKIDLKVTDIELPLEFWSRRNMYKLFFVMDNTEIEPDKKLITMDLLRSYETTFYAPLSFKRKIVTCKIVKVYELEEFEIGRFEVDFGGVEMMGCVSEIANRFGKKIGRIMFSATAQQPLKKVNEALVLDKQSLPSLGCSTHGGDSMITNNSANQSNQM